MAGRHDRSAEEAGAGLIATGPIVVRGMTRGVRGALQSDRGARHRSGVGGAMPAHRGSAVRDADGRTDEAGGTDLTDECSSSDHGEEAAPGFRPAAGGQAAAATGAQGRVPRSRADSDPADRAAAADGLVTDGEEADQDEYGPTRVRGLARLRERRGFVGLAVLAALAVVCAGLIIAVLLKTRADADAAAREAASYSPPPLASASSATSGPSIAVVSDETAAGSARDVGRADRWPRLLADAVHGDLDLRALSGAGYTASRNGGKTFVDAAEQIPPQADVVLFVGGAADGDATALSVARAATEAFSAASQRAPGAVVVAVGPLFRPAGLDEQAFAELRTSLRTSARVAGVRWVDPVSSQWLSSVSRATDLTSADERSVAQRLRSVVIDAG